MSNDVDPNSKRDSAEQGCNKMNSSGPTSSETLPDAASVPESNDCVQGADEKQGSRDLERKSRIVESGLTDHMELNSNAEHHG